MKPSIRPFVLFLALCGVLHAGSATLFDSTSTTRLATSTKTVVFGDYQNASSVTIHVSASAYAGSQSGGGRNYNGYAEAVIGTNTQTQNVPNGSDPLSIAISNNATFTKGADGWYLGATNVGNSITVSAYAYADGENADGSATVYANASWVETPTYTLTINVIGSGTVTGAGQYTAGQTANIGATAASGRYFKEWTGAIASTSSSETVYMDSDKTVTAEFPFVPNPKRAPTISWTSQPGTVASGATFAVSVLAQPTGPSQTCTVSGASGTVGAGAITSVTVDCTTDRFTIGGTISGLAGTVVLQDNGGDNLTVTTNGTFAFSTPVASGAAYAVTVLT